MLKSVNMMSKKCFPPLSLVALRSSSCFHCGLSQYPISCGSLIYASERLCDNKTQERDLLGILKIINLSTWRDKRPKPNFNEKALSWLAPPVKNSVVFHKFLFLFIEFFFFFVSITFEELYSDG